MHPYENKINVKREITYYNILQCTIRNDIIMYLLFIECKLCIQTDQATTQPENVSKMMSEFIYLIYPTYCFHKTDLDSVDNP